MRLVKWLPVVVALAPWNLARADVTVFAAASLKDAFTEVAKVYEQSGGSKVRLNFAGSQQLSAQIQAGAAADVFASADQQNLDSAGVDKGTARTFARNRLVLVVPPSSSLKSFKSLSGAKRVVVAAPKVPAGHYAREALDRAVQYYGQAWKDTVLRHVVSEEQDVRAVLAKVQLGEADAGIVYASDAQSAGKKVRSIPLPDTIGFVVSYPVAVVSGTRQAQEAKDFIEFLVSKKGQSILEKYGFLRAQPQKARGSGSLELSLGVTAYAVVTQSD